MVAQNSYTQPTSLTISRPDDWHIHLRDGDALSLTVKDVSHQFGRAIVMPNLKPPVTSTDAAMAYKNRIQENIPKGSSFEPLMTLYLTQTLSTEELSLAKNSGFIHGVKMYPAGATTNSQDGILDLTGIYPVLAHMESIDLPLLIHGEVANPNHDIFDREKLFLEQQMADIVATFPKLRIVLEHITTKEAVEFVRNAPKNVAATITAHHLLYNRNAMLNGGIRPHLYCLPILKRASHQTALIEAATSGNPKFFLGTDSAPHAQQHKETDCGCAGCYTAYAAIEMYAEVFEKANALDKLEGFASHLVQIFINCLVTLKRSPLKNQTGKHPQHFQWEPTPSFHCEQTKHSHGSYKHQKMNVKNKRFSIMTFIIFYKCLSYLHKTINGRSTPKDSICL